MSEHYILFSIGPVQNAIAQARRTQDLWAGSQMLSSLALAGLVFADEQGADVVFPQPDFSASQLTIPNRFLVRVDDTDVKGFADRVEGVIRKRWSKMADVTADNLLEDGMHFNREKLWNRQIEDYLEVYYVIVPLSGDYREDLEQLNLRLNARKQLRAFEQNDEHGFKCSVTGEQEVLHDQEPGTITHSTLEQYWETLRQSQANKALLSQGERLGAPAMLKRVVHLYDTELNITRFPSTSSISSAAFRAGIVANWNSVRETIDAYIEALIAVFKTVNANERDLFFAEVELLPYVKEIISSNPDLTQDSLLDSFLKLDGDWLYPEALTVRQIETYTRETFDRTTRNSLQKALDEPRKSLKKLYQRVTEIREALLKDNPDDPFLINLAKPSSYYAMLMMDGDNMGALRYVDEDDHRCNSRILSRFAGNEVRQIIEHECPGRLIYAGGDDLLAMLPLPYLLHAMRRIQNEFERLDVNTSISAGAVVIHRTHPLQEAVKAAKESESNAKATPGKNAFSIAFLRRSGESRSGTAHWRVDQQDVLLCLQRISKAMEHGLIARNFIRDIVSMGYAQVSRLEPDDEAYVTIPSGARRAEFERILERHSSRAYREINVDLVEALITIAESEGYGQAWLSLIDLLQIAKFIAQEGGIYYVA